MAIVGIITKGSVSSLASSCFSKYSGAPQGHHVIFHAKGPPLPPPPYISLLYIIYHISLLHPRWDEQCRDTMMTVPPQLTSSLPSFSYPASFRHPPPASSFSVPFVPGSFFKDAERWYKEDARSALQSAIRSDSRAMHMRDADHIEVPKLYDICAKIQQVQQKHHMTRRPGHRRLARHGFLLPRSRLPDKYPSDFSLQRSALQTWTCGRNCRPKPSGKLERGRVENWSLRCVQIATCEECVQFVPQTCREWERCGACKASLWPEHVDDELSWVTSCLEYWAGFPS